MTKSSLPSFGLHGKVVMVSGAGRGIGRACALACAEAGADIVAIVRDDNAGKDLTSAVEALGRRALIVPLDIAETRRIEDAVRDAVAHFGQIDILVNNIGISRRSLAQSVSEEDFDLILGTNLKGTFFLTQAVARTMIERRAGRILNISSQAGTVTLREESIYCMSKAAINHLSRCLAAEWGPLGIAVNSISPTFIWTDSTRPYLSDPEAHRQTLAHIPLGRIGETEDVAGAVVYLASPAGALVNGANLMIDGGWSIA
ncbi:MAG: glucose 1-dehydrogenase [Mesorhizobium sp.]|uniref:SDR family NAD(P)-dependent oxidoreductase n=1 Tax=Mesorhizobium sp. TaxID=1871066 RepID=UPI001218E7B6|nr:glucose 1-dehydrogenase [Mesorhizobium sp.]TIR27422.1 MAG: glucose 1-dehydrogenase [Mesorhizobium sp.]